MPLPAGSSSLTAVCHTAPLRGGTSLPLSLGRWYAAGGLSLVPRCRRPCTLRLCDAYFLAVPAHGHAGSCGAQSPSICRGDPGLAGVGSLVFEIRVIIA